MRGVGVGGGEGRKLLAPEGLTPRFPCLPWQSPPGSSPWPCGGLGGPDGNDRGRVPRQPCAGFWSCLAVGARLSRGLRFPSGPGRAGWAAGGGVPPPPPGTPRRHVFSRFCAPLPAEWVCRGGIIFFDMLFVHLFFFFVVKSKRAQSHSAQGEKICRIRRNLNIFTE